jgi:methylglyoxal synthase
MQDIAVSYNHTKVATKRIDLHIIVKDSLPFVTHNHIVKVVVRSQTVVDLTHCYSQAANTILVGHNNLKVHLESLKAN